MYLTDEQQAILDGRQGELLQKTMETLVRYGEVYEADRMVELDGPVQLVCSFAMAPLRPFFKILGEFKAAGIKTKLPFTADPRPMDFENMGFHGNTVEETVYKKLYSAQPEYEELLKSVGLKDQDAFSCACYFDEIGNTPSYGDKLAWAESSAVVYANSVLGARTNRNSGVIEIFSGILGLTPNFGFMTDEGRKADWVIELKTTKLPRPQILGSAIGFKVMEKVPYIKGLDKYLGTEIDQNAKDFLKDMGAATASNGAVGLYHVENLTPEAKEHGEALIREGAQTYVIDDAELERVKNSYPILWKYEHAIPYKAFIGCPHCSYDQLIQWAEKFEEALKRHNKKRISVDTVICSAPAVIRRFKETPYYERLTKIGVEIGGVCPLMRVSGMDGVPVITNSNKLRTYSKSRYLDDDELVDVIVTGGGL